MPIPFLKPVKYHIWLIFTLLMINREVAGQEVISWMNLQRSLEHAGYQMFFEGAAFYPDKSDLPYFVKDYPAREHSDSAIASIESAVYAPLSEDEKAVLGDNKLISNEIQPRVQTVTIRKQPFFRVSFLPFRINPQSKQPEKLLNFRVDIQEVPVSYGVSVVKAGTAAEHSVLSSGTWYKIGLKKTGIYRITYTDLQAMGINPATVDPRDIRIYGNGAGMLPESNAVARIDDLKENAIMVVGGDDGSFDAGDYILFFGQSPLVWKYNQAADKFTHQVHYYSDYTYYFLNTGLGPGKRISAKTGSTLPATHVLTTYINYASHELEQYNLIKSGKTWYGEKFDLKLSYELPQFNFLNIDDQQEVYFECDVAARSTTISSFKAFVNGGEAVQIFVPPVSTAFNTDYAFPGNAGRKFFLNKEQVSVKIDYYPSVVNSIGWLNYVLFNVPCHLVFTGPQMSFRNPVSLGAGNVSEYRINSAPASLKVWDVTDPLEPEMIDATAQGGMLAFKLGSDTLREFIAYDATSWLNIETYEKIDNQDLHSLEPADLIIIAHPDFINQAERLAGFHRLEGMTVLVVPVYSVYNEFSGGAQDVSALRDFLRMLYLKASPGSEPSHILLFGDASYDYKERVENNTNFVPTYQSLNALRPTESFATDDFFGLMDSNEGNNSNGNLDIGVGRLVVKNVKEAKDVVDKIERYMGLSEDSTACQTFANSVARLGDWRNMICFVADDEDNNMHLDQAETMAQYIDTAFDEYVIDKIYFDSYKQQSTPGGQRYPEVNDDINKRVAKGALIVNYTGHGGETGWGHERVLEVADINNWANRQDMPVFVTATCEFSRFDDPERNSAGEYVFLNPNGGGIALFSTSRLSFSSTNFALNLNFYYNVFKRNQGEYLRLGDVMRLAKTPSNPNILNFILMGDPALRMVYPRYKIETSAINGSPVSGTPDTLKALSKTTISGFVKDDQGNVLSGFNGVLFPVIFDKPTEIKTLGNDPESSPTSFLLQKNIIYRGKVSVVNGEFSFDFIVPRDIAYKYGNGKISYYAENGLTDANGAFRNFVIGGSELISEPDDEGPVIKLYMNDTTFVDGGMTDEKPFMLAHVYDEHGINTVGNGIGHDIVATLDDNSSQSYVLNDFYEADLDSYRSGTIRFPFSGLAPGLHRLRLKVWDTYNNSSEAEISFFVRSSSGLNLENLQNYPNPFSDRTEFYFKHNQSCCALNVTLDIVSILGDLVKSIRTTLVPEGYTAGPVVWNGMTEDGGRVRSGVYICRLKVESENGETAFKSSKLVVVNK